MFVPDAIPGERVRVRLTDVGQEVASGAARRSRSWMPRPTGSPHIWRQADIDVPPELRPGGADFGHIELSHQRALKLEVLTDALKRFGGVERCRRSPLHAATGAEGRGGVRRRHRLAHAREPSRRRRRPRRSVRRAQPPVIAGRGPIRSRRPRSSAPRWRSHGGRPGRIDLVQPADGRVRVIPRRGCGARAAPARGAARSSSSASGDASSAWMPADSGRCTASPRRRSTRRAARAAGCADSAAADGDVLDPDAWHLDLYGGVGLFAAALGELGGGTR